MPVGAPRSIAQPATVTGPRPVAPFAGLSIDRTTLLVVPPPLMLIGAVEYRPYCSMPSFAWMMMYYCPVGTDAAFHWNEPVPIARFDAIAVMPSAGSVLVS